MGQFLLKRLLWGGYNEQQRKFNKLQIKLMN